MGDNCELFQFFQRQSTRFERNFLQSIVNFFNFFKDSQHDSNEVFSKQLWTFSIFSKTVNTIRTKFSTVILKHIEVLSKIPYRFFSKTVVTIRTKIPTAILHFMGDNCDFFSIFSKTVNTIRTKFSTVILKHIEVLSKIPYRFFSETVVKIRTKIPTAILHFLGTYVCNDINIVKLGFEKQPKLTKE